MKSEYECRYKWTLLYPPPPPLHTIWLMKWATSIAELCHIQITKCNATKLANASICDANKIIATIKSDTGARKQIENGCWLMDGANERLRNREFQRMRQKAVNWIPLIEIFPIINDLSSHSSRPVALMFVMKSKCQTFMRRGFVK